MIVKRVHRQFSDADMVQSQGLFFSLASPHGTKTETSAKGIKRDAFWKVIDKPCIVVDAETDEVLLIFDKNRLSVDNIETAYNVLQPVAKSNSNSNRGVAGGYLDMQKVYKARPNFKIGKSTDFRVYPMKKDGQIGKTHYCNPVSSSIVGWTDIPKRDERSQKCRLTAFSARNLQKFKQTFPFFEEIDAVYEELAPEAYQTQKEFSDNTVARVGDTVFSTITVNHNWRSALHKDAGDYKGGLGAFTVVQSSKMGGELLFPEYGIAVRVCTSDVLLFNSHLWHCNAPVTAHDRLTFVCYMRSKIPANCPRQTASKRSKSLSRAASRVVSKRRASIK